MSHPIQNPSNRPQSPKSGAARLARLAAPVLMLLAAGPAQAAPYDILDTILTRSTQARDRAIQARDRSTEARNRIRDLGEQVEDGLQHLTGDVRVAIGESVDWVRALLEAQLAGRDEFVSNHAEAFRADLIGFLLDLQALREEVASLTRPCAPGGPPQGDLSILIALIEGAPAGVLYPVWKGIDVDLCLVDAMGQGVGALQSIRLILGGLDGVLGVDIDVTDVLGDSTPRTLDANLHAVRYAAARPYIAHYNELADAAGKIQRLSFMLKLIGSKLKSQGETTVQGTLGVHGYAMMKVSSNPRKSMASEIDSLATVLGTLHGLVKTKLNEAKEVSATNLIITRQEEILLALRNG